MAISNRGDGDVATGRAWVEVNLDAVRANFGTVRSAVGDGTAIIPMVKADGYGLGAARIASALEPLDPWGYGVATAEEGAALRDRGIGRPILVVGPVPTAHTALAAASGLTVSVSSMSGLEAWVAAADAVGRPLDFHVEVDTGMGRSGFDWRETGAWAEAVAARVSERVRWTGVFTHFHSADGPDARPTAVQWERFQDTLVQLPVSREDLMVHAANSAAALRWPKYAADAVRPGIFLYGGEAAPEVDGVPEPAAVAAVKARLTLVRDVPPGTTIGYGATQWAKGWERWGTLAIGYGDGVPRILGNRGSVLVHGRRVPMIGRVSMDMTTVDLGRARDADAGEVAVLIGRQGNERITVDEVAGQAETIAYEILTGLASRLPRIEVS